ncbi:UV DNA damage repair endonuclease UvsE [Bacillus massiliigorillae]|uniref:UV DNA damage repair endonuclease UvsE n=1 Tax=Bacillus massiliigorillae TaxID=1243664 RepID=UPI00039AAB26|nr:UV DNA damage repair endonuclease UvsE [Bacillus massiliigorillae]
MIIRFGYVSTAITLWDASPSKTVTFKRYSQLAEEERLAKLQAVTLTNITNTKRMLYYNVAHEIELYRLSSSIVPLATHPEVQWDFVTPFHNEWQELGQIIKNNKMRVSFHPNQFTLFTSPKIEITNNSVRDLEYHYKMLEAMRIEDDSYMNIHVGGAYGDKVSSLARFHDNIKQVPPHIKTRMTLENDDKTYTASETLAVCEREHIPCVFDYHHHMANLCEEPLNELLPRIFQTWQHTGLNPKIHISSPKSEKEFRSHSDFVDLDFIQPFLSELKKCHVDVDFMIEAKSKDQALLRLVEDISKIRGTKRISGAIVTM